MVGAGPLEEAPLRADNKDKRIVAVFLDLANLADQVDNDAPTEIARQFAANKTCQQLFMIMTDMCVHQASIPPAHEQWLVRFAQIIPTQARLFTTSSAAARRRRLGCTSSLWCRDFSVPILPA